MIEVNLAILADAANTSAEGKLNILGEFNMLMTEAPPWMLVGRSLVVRLVGHAGDEGPHTVGLRLLDQDRNLVWSSGDAAIDFPRARVAGAPARLQAIMGLPPLILPTAGDYELEILIDGEAKGCIELYCILRGDVPGHAEG